MNSNLRFLAQLRPTRSTPELLFSPKTGEQVLAVQIIIANLTNTSLEYSIYFDNDGATADETTALAFSVEIEARNTQIIEINIPIANSNGGLYVQTSSENNLNFTLTGEK